MRNPCENCEKYEQVQDSLCSSCILEGFAVALALDDPHLKRFQELELKSRDLTPSEKALEIQAAKGYGWIQD